MYQSSEPSGDLGAVTRPPWRWPRVPANVWALGATSLLTDVSSEMVTSILPLYVVLHLQLTPLAFGAVDGLYQGVAAVVRTGSGVVADRQRRHKTIAATGYVVSAFAKLGYLAAGAWWPAFLGVVIGDRLGKGIRTAPRDALIAASARPAEMATAFGLHRTMDAAGAALGPLAAFAVLALTPGRFDQVFVVSFAIACVGVAALLLLVRPPHDPADSADAPLARTSTPFGVIVRTAGFRPVLVAASAVSLATISDGLIYLLLQRHLQFDPTRLTLLFVGTPFCYFLLAGPFGVVADRLGTRRLFIAGHGALLLLYVLLWLAPPVPALIGACLLLLGAYYAATDGILAAMATRVLPADSRATGLGVLATCTTAARGLAAVAFGALWTYTSSGVALATAGVVLLCAVALAAHQLAAHEPRPSAGARR